MEDKTVVELAKLLKIKPDKVVGYLVVPLGQSVKKGQLLAQRKRLGLVSKKVFAPQDGLVSKIETATGCLILTTEEESKNELLSKVNQKMKAKEKEEEKNQDMGQPKDEDKRKDKHKEKKKTLASREASVVFGWGKGEGELIKAKEETSLKGLIPGWKGKVVWLRGLLEPGVVFKAEALGIKGLIIFTEMEKTALKEKWAEVAEASDLAVLFVKKALAAKLKKMLGKEIEVNGDKGIINES